MSDQIEPLALSQAELLEVLNKWYGTNSNETRSRIRNRFKSLLKVDLPSGKRPQHGKKEKYSFLQVCEVIMCFHLAQYGLDAWSISATTVNDPLSYGDTKSYMSNEVLNCAELIRDMTVLYLENTKSPTIYGKFDFRFVSHSIGHNAAITCDGYYSEREILGPLENSLGGLIINFNSISYALARLLPQENINSFMEGRKNTMHP